MELVQVLQIGAAQRNKEKSFQQTQTPDRNNGAQI